MLKTTNVENWLELVFWIPRSNAKQVLQSVFQEIQSNKLGKFPNISIRDFKDSHLLINLKIHRRKEDNDKLKQLLQIQLGNYELVFDPKQLQDYCKYFTWITDLDVMKTWTEKNAEYLHKISKFVLDSIEPDTQHIYRNGELNSTWGHMLDNMILIWNNTKTL